MLLKGLVRKIHSVLIMAGFVLIKTGLETKTVNLRWCLYCNYCLPCYMNILLPVRFHIRNSIIPHVWDKSYGTIRIPALTCYLSLLPIPLGLGVAWSDSCEKEYLKRLPRLCWVMIVTPNWPHEFPVVIFSFLFLGFLHICGFILLLAELEFKNFSRFSHRPISFIQYSLMFLSWVN